MMLNLCITCDHELYFGQNYCSEEDVLINPTNELASVLENNNVRATFFIDVCSVFQYRAYNLLDFPNKIENQLLELIKSGHDVQLHIHPHWYYSKYSNGQWQFDKSKYRIHPFGFNTKGDANISADQIIENGKNYLEQLLTPVSKTYKCVAFRAGGLCLQPEHELLRALKKNNIHIDSSVVPGTCAETDVHFYSYLKTPTSLHWWVNPDVGINKDSGLNIKQNLLEVSIGSFNKKPMLWLLKIKRKRINAKEPSRGSFAVASARKNSITNFIAKAKGFLNSPIVMSFDAIDADTLINIVKYYTIEFDCENNDYFVAFICHPKILRDEHIKNIDAFIKSATKKFEYVKFTTLSQVYQLYA